MAETHAEIRLPTRELREDLKFFTDTLGMRLDTIYPADDPRVAVFSGHGLRLRLEAGAPESPGTVLIRTEDPETFAGGKRELSAPNGTRIIVDELNPPLVLPPTLHSFVVRRLTDQAPWIVGRAGMEYRDLIPDRLGGSIIASHIRIPDGGPVPDMVHYHTVGFQLIFCIGGWVDVVYEDQGPPIRLHAGNCFIQPPEIRHRVLCASDNVEVIEIGVPAEHITTIDHEMALPTPHIRPDREWSGQKFVHHEADRAVWAPHRLPGYISRDTTISENTGGVADVRVVKRGDGDPQWRRHDADILFTFVMNGALTLEGDGREPHRLEAGDAFVIPPDMLTRLSDPTDGAEFLEVILPARFRTEP